MVEAFTAGRAPILFSCLLKDDTFDLHLHLFSLPLQLLSICDVNFNSKLISCYPSLRALLQWLSVFINAYNFCMNC